MSQSILMPKLGNTVESVIIVAWHKGIGDSVAMGDVLCEVETDKASVEVEAEQEGILLAQLHEPGDEVPVLAPFAVLGKSGETVPEQPEPIADKGSADAQPSLVPPRSVPTPIPPAAVLGKTPVGVSPRARKLAASLKLQELPPEGTGPGGRLIERDVQNASISRPMHPDTQIDRDYPGPLEYLPLIDDSEMILPGGPLVLHVSVQADSLLSWLEVLRHYPCAADGEGSCIKDIVLFVIARLLLRFPSLNAVFDKAVNRIVRYRHVHLKFPVDTEQKEMLMPVLRFADVMPLTAVSAERQRLTQACHERNPDILEGGTFVVENYADFGMETVVPAMAGPQIAALGVGALKATAGGTSGINFALAADCRFVDRSAAVRFMQEFAASMTHFDRFMARIDPGSLSQNSPWSAYSVEKPA